MLHCLWSFCRISSEVEVWYLDTWGETTQRRAKLKQKYKARNHVYVHKKLPHFWSTSSLLNKNMHVDITCTMDKSRTRIEATLSPNPSCTYAVLACKPQDSAGACKWRPNVIYVSKILPFSYPKRFVQSNLKFFIFCHLQHCAFTVHVPSDFYGFFRFKTLHIISCPRIKAALATAKSWKVAR